MTAPAIPNTSDGLLESLSDENKRKELLSDPKAFANWIGEYVKVNAKNDPGVQEQITNERIESQKVMAALIKEFGQNSVKRVNMADQAQRKAAGTGKPRNTLYNPRALGAKIDTEGLFTDLDDYLRTTWVSDRNRGEGLEAKRAALTKIRNDYGTVAPSDGGFLVPESLRSELLRVSLETGVVRSRARVIPMDTLRVPFPTIDSTSNASNVYGGVTAYWAEESAALTESQATFGRVVLQANKLTAYAEVPNELMSDSIISFAAFIEQIYPEALAWFEDVAFFDGTGVGEPLGFLRADAAVSVTKESGQAADTIVLENILTMYSRMLPTSLNRAVWVANIDTFKELYTMALSVGTGGSAVMLTNAHDGPALTILGRPVIFSEKPPTIGDAGDINFVDFGYYLIGDRQTMTSETSTHYKFANDQTATRFIQRLDGRPWLQSAITPKTGSNTLSPFVKIAARA